jgi:hypothetical protein
MLVFQQPVSHRVLFVVITSWLACQALIAAEPDQPDSPDQPDYTQYVLETFTAMPGKVDDVHAWFRAHQQDVIAKCGATPLAYLVPVGENPERRLLCFHKHPSTRAMLAFGQAVRVDPRWEPMNPDSGSPDRLVQKIEYMTFSLMDYSPKFSPTIAAEPRVFELRTYTCPSSAMLVHLNDRFREHTMGLFKKHGMENLIYLRPLDIDDSDRKLIYFLAHKSQDAAKESFAAFRKDPEWLYAKQDSEEKAGGPLTEKENGVVSEFFIATDYSPLK